MPWDCGHPIPVPALDRGREGDPAGDPEPPVLAGWDVLWEQLGQDGPWSGAQKRKHRSETAPHQLHGQQGCAGACQSQGESELELGGLFPEGGNSVQKVKEVFDK